MISCFTTYSTRLDQKCNAFTLNALQCLDFPSWRPKHGISVKGEHAPFKVHNVSNNTGLSLIKFVHTELPQVVLELGLLGPQVGVLPNEPPLLGIKVSLYILATELPPKD